MKRFGSCRKFFSYSWAAQRPLWGTPVVSLGCPRVGMTSRGCEGDRNSGHRGAGDQGAGCRVLAIWVLAVGVLAIGVLAVGVLAVRVLSFMVLAIRVLSFGVLAVGVRAGSEHVNASARQPELCDVAGVHGSDQRELTRGNTMSLGTRGRIITRKIPKGFRLGNN